MAKKVAVAKKAVVSKKASKKPVAASKAKTPVAKKTVRKTVTPAVKAPVAAETPVVKKARAPRKPRAVAKPVLEAETVLPQAPLEPVEAAEKPSAPQIDPALQADPILLQRILTSLDDDKAEEIMTIDLGGRSSLCDAIVVASGRSSRHVSSIAEHLARRLKEAGYGTRPVNGAGQGDWALVDAGDVIVHIFRPEVRSYYDLEGMWSVDEAPQTRKGVRS